MSLVTNNQAKLNISLGFYISSIKLGYNALKPLAVSDGSVYTKRIHKNIKNRIK